MARNRVDKVSAIVPTVWRAKEFTDHLVNVLIHDESVGEIIIIDNAPTDFFYDNEKVVTLKQQENLYVNPSWNLGVEESDYDKFIILNDDIIIPYNFVFQLEEWITEDIGLIGLDSASIIKATHFDAENITKLDRKIELQSVVNRNWGFGMAIVGHKKSYYKIPENIRIWYGDDYLFQMNNEAGKTNYVIDDIPIFTKISSTSDLEEFDEIKNIDTLMYDRMKGNNNG